MINCVDIKELFKIWADIMMDNKEYLIDLDSVVGDGDLGLTMSDGFKAGYQAIKDSELEDMGKIFYSAGKAMSTAVPSTMGTLMASGLMQAGKELKGKSTLNREDFLIVFEAYFNGVSARGKAKVGEKTFLDGFDPAVKELKECIDKDIDIKIAAEKMLEASKTGLDNTTTMIAVHGRAATRGENSRKLLDPGANVAYFIFQGFLNFIQNI